MFRKLPLLLLVTACVAGCQLDDDAATPLVSEAESHLEPTSAPLLQLRLSSTHTVKFLEASVGEVEVIEDMHADQDRARPSLAALDPGRVTLAEIHAHLRPGVRVPDVLGDADTRAAARAPRPPEVPVPADAFTQADALGPSVPPSAGQSWDWVADEAWFRQSFEGNAWFRVKRTYSCPPGTCSSTSYNGPVGNRQITTYLGTGRRYRQAWMDGSGVNPRVGLATRWVLDSQGTPTPSPSQCGGHVQLACFPGTACDGWNVPYNGACYACGTVGQPCCKDWGPIPTSGGWQGFCAQGVCGYPGGYCQ